MIEDIGVSMSIAFKKSSKRAVKEYLDRCESLGKILVPNKK